MQESTLNFLKDHLSNEQKELLRCDPEDIRGDMGKKTDEQRFEKAAERYKNPRLALLQAVHKAETRPGPETIRQVICCAVKADDFVTALHWHQKLLSGKTVKLSDKFERYYYTLMAERQKEQEPGAKPCTGVQQICQRASDTSHALRDPQYLEHAIAYRTRLAEAYQEKFDAAEKSVFLPAKKKDDNATWIQLLISAVLLVLGVVLLWKTYGIVARAVRAFFRYSILSLISWIIPLLYALIVIILVILVWYLLIKDIGSGNKKKLKKSIREITYQIERSLAETEDFLSLQVMDKDLPEKFQSYDARLVLAALSAMSGEKNTIKLCEMAKDDSTWLTRLVPPEKYAKNPYEKKIESLIRRKAPDSDLFLGYTLYRKQSPHEAEYEADFISIYRNVFFGGSGYEKERILFYMVERFLREEALMAEDRRDYKRMGEAYFNLYDLYTHAATLFSDSTIDKEAYRYGSLGIDHSDELKYHIMYTYACYEKYHEYYNPYLSLGFTRTDAETYAAELVRKGDPRGKELRNHFEEVDRRTAERAAEAEAEKARAFWEEKSRLMREAEETREKARAELNARMDTAEREENLLLRDSFSTEEERALRGEQSELDHIRHQTLRDAVIRKKLNDM